MENLYYGGMAETASGVDTKGSQIGWKDLYNAEVRGQGDEFLEIAKKKVFDRLQELGLIERVGAGNKIIKLNNLEIFRGGKIAFITDQATRQLSLKQVLEKTATTILDSPKYGKRNPFRALYWLFRNEEVITKTDYDLAQESGGALPVRSFYYVPDNSGSAMDIDEVKKNVDKFYFIYPELARKSWTDNYPTKDSDFDSGLSMFEGAVPMMIWGRGGASSVRDGEGRILVSKVVANPGEVQPISGPWFIRNYGWNGVGGYKWKDKPAEIVRKFGKNLIKKGLLLESDFRHHEFRGRINDTGMWTLPNSGLRYYLGRNLVGGEVVRVSKHDFVIIKEGRAVAWFDPEITGKLRRGYGVGERGTTWVVTKGLFRQSKVSELNFHVPREEGVSPGWDKVVVANEITGLVRFRSKFKEQFKALNLDKFSLKEQIAAKRMMQKYGEDANDFVAKIGEPGLQLLADGFLNGGFDKRLFGLSTDFSERKVVVLRSYHNLHQSLAKLKIGMQENESIAKLPPLVKGGVEAFSSRVISAFEKRSQTFLVAAALGYESEAGEQLQILGKALEGLAEILRGSDRYRIDRFSPNLDGSTGVVTSVTGIFHSETGENVNILIRPKRIEGDRKKGGGQARFGFKYTDKEGAMISLRIDYDKDYGLNLDLDSSGGSTAGLLGQIGETYHTPGAFDSIFNDPKRLEAVLEGMGLAIGYDFSGSRPIVSAKQR